MTLKQALLGIGAFGYMRLWVRKPPHTPHPPPLWVMNMDLVTWYSSFLHNQCSTLTIDNKNFTRALTKGTPQGGVLSPIVWNINFDEILKKLDQKPIKTVSFADDSVLLITGIDPSMMVYMIQPALNEIVAWGHESGLEFNASKTMVSWYTTKPVQLCT
jgi:hypothetical protein